MPVIRSLAELPALLTDCMTAARFGFGNCAASTIAGAVVAVQESVWGRDGETVPAAVLLVSAKRGGILMGASPV